jgi:hypothetical protein
MKVASGSGAPSDCGFSKTGASLCPWGDSPKRRLPLILLYHTVNYDLGVGLFLCQVVNVFLLLQNPGNVSPCQ